MYYNTTNEVNPQLTIFKHKATNQDKQIFEIAKKLKTFSAAKIYNLYPGNIPITSVRRSLNTLMNSRLIERTGNKVMGIYSRKEFEYKVI